jgi:hypothetical protein
MFQNKERFVPKKNKRGICRNEKVGKDRKIWRFPPRSMQE